MVDTQDRSSRSPTHPPGSATPRASNLDRRDAIATALLALGWVAVYGATLKSLLFGDGRALLRGVLYESHDYLWVHVAYVPLGRAFAAATAFDTTADALRWFSVLCAALGVALVFPIARAYGARPLSSALATCLVAAAPAQWFWSTTIEVHALHVLAVTATAVTTLVLPWRRLAIALPVAALLSLSLHLSHQSGVLLQPAFCLLAVHARERASGVPVGRRRVWFAFVPAFGVAALAAIAIGRLLHGGSGLTSPGGMLDFFREYRQPWSWDRVWSMWGWPLGLVWIAPFLLVAARSSRPVARIGRVAALASLPFLVIFTWFGFPERGAYALGFLPFWAAGAGVALDHLVRAPSRLAVAATLVVTAQAVIGLATTTNPSDAEWLRRHRARCEFVDGFSDRSTYVIAFNMTGQTIESETEDVREIDLLREVRWAATSGASDAVMRAIWDTTLRTALAVPDACVVFDLGHRGRMKGSPDLARIATLIEDHTRATCPHEVFVHDGVEYWLLGPR